jgi:TonB family protein
MLVTLIALCSQFLCASDSADSQQAVRRIEQAVSKTNIFELTSFQMKANVQIENQGKRLDGHYQLLWNGPDQWREEIAFPGYTEVQVGGKGIVWIQRNTAFFPLRIWNLHAAFGFGSGAGSGPDLGGSFVHSGLTAKDTIKKVHSRKEDGDQLTCIEIEDERKLRSDICVNDATDVMVRNSSYKDRDFQPIGGKLFPRFLSFVENGKEVASIDIIELTTPGQFSPGSFTPPSGVTPRAGCMNPVPPRISKKVFPEYPQTERERHVQGTVAVDTWIGADGVPRIGPVVSHASPGLEQSSLSAITQWRYEPATCNGTAVDVQTVLKVNYTLSP